MIRLIRSESSHAEALAEIERLWEAKPGTAEHDRLEVLGLLVAEYEERVLPIKAPSPIDAVQFRLDQLGLERKDLLPILGSRARISEVFSGARKLSTEMIKRLHQHLGIPYESLLGG